MGNIDWNDLASLAKKLVPYLLPYLPSAKAAPSGSTGGGGGVAPSPHDLFSGHHIGELDPSQATWALRADGSVALVGNLPVVAGVTIDGVDLSAFKTLYDAHAAATAVAAHGSVGAHNHQTTTNGGQLDHGAALTGLGDDDHTQYLHLSTPRTVTGAHTWQATQTMRSIAMEAGNLYDLGASTSLVRKIWASELDTILLAQNTKTIVGGWLAIGKGEGKLNAAATSGATTMDFGQAMTTGHRVEFRASGAFEIVTVGTLSAGTVYNVTRNVDGSGANAWASGTPYFIRGTTGDGRIELNASDTPRLQMIVEGASYGAEVEKLRLGDLNGNWGYVAETWGVGIGQYAASKPNITIDDTNGLRIRTHSTTVIQLDVSGNATIEGVLKLGASGGLWQGTGTFASPTDAIKMWSNSGKMAISGYDGGVEGWRLRGEEGFTLKAGTSGEVITDIPSQTIRWFGTIATLTTPVARIGAYLEGDTPGALNHTLLVEAQGDGTTKGGHLRLIASDGDSTDTEIQLHASPETSGGPYDYMSFTVKGSQYLRMEDDFIRLYKPVQVNRSSVNYEPSFPIYLASPLTSTSWDGNDTKAVGTHTIDTSAVFSVPAGVAAVYVQLGGTWVAASNGSAASLRAQGAATNVAGIRAQVANFQQDGTWWIPCDSNGDIELAVAGVQVTNTLMRIHGYAFK